MLTIPLTFPNTSILRSNEPSHPEWGNIIEHSFLAADPTSLEYWEGDSDDCGILVGCSDGTIYVFSHTTIPLVAQSDSGEHRRRRAFPISKGATPTTPTTPSLSLSWTRPRAISGLTIERVEAPKNYVDFEDQPERLKDILHGRTPKQSIAPEPTPSVAVSPAPPITEIDTPPAKRRGSPRSLLSIKSSLPPTPRSFSAPGSPRSDRPSPWAPTFSLRCHIIPDCAGSGHAVRDVKILEGNQHAAVLHQPGELAIYSLKDGECVASMHVADGVGEPMSREVWNWCSLQVGSADEDVLLFVTAATDSSTSAPTPDVEELGSEKSQTVIVKLSMGTEGILLERLGRCHLDGPARGVGVYQSDETTAMISVNAQGHLLIRQLHLSQQTPELPSTSSTTPDSEHLGPIPFPRSLKAMVKRSPDNVNTEPSHVPCTRMTLLEPRDVGLLLSDTTFSGLATRNDKGVLYGIVWAHREMTVFSYHLGMLHVLFRSQVAHLEDAEWLDNETYALSFNDRMEVYKLKVVDAKNDGPGSFHQGFGLCHRADLARILPTGTHEAGAFIPSSDLIVTKLDKRGFRTLVTYHVRPCAATSTVLWQPSSAQQHKTSTEIVQTSSLPFDLEGIVQGYSDGYLRQFSLEQMVLRNPQSSALPPEACLQTSSPKLNGALVSLDIVRNSRTRERYIVGGVDDGSIVFWNMATFETCARWVAFSTPLARAIDFDHDSAGFLHGCVLCIAADGTIAVIFIDGFQFLYMIPGTSSSLSRLCVNGSSLLLMYGNQLARVWDIQAKEFHRSMSTDKAEEMLRQGDWFSISMDPNSLPARSEWRTIAPALTGRDAVSTLSFSLDKFVSEAIALTKTISTNKDEVRSILRTFDRLRLLLSVVLTPGLSPDIDSICAGKLRLHTASVCMGLTSLRTTTLYPCANSRDPWRISGNVSAARMLSIVFVLKALSLFEDCAEAASAAISFYTTSLGPCIGSTYVYPSLEYFGRMWFIASTELRHAIRVVFDATVVHMTDQEIINIAEKWQEFLPHCQPKSERESLKTALALYICGSIAADRFSLFSVNALVDISKSVALYFHDEDSTHRNLAIELCSKGFHVWQQYVDTLDILRSLFMLATTTRKASAAAHAVGLQARTAVLSIAAHDTALFMSTLSLDVLNPSSLEHRRSVMQIIAFLIRKRPLILQPHLPRLMEAVVKSLDPNSNANRDAVLGAATEIIGFVVKTYPTVDFHMASQRLAVGTSEGVVVMYDLKTATRLYVLEGHRQQLAACSFSPDGRRLVTMSLADRHVLVWKVGTGFASFFTHGLPRQGHAGTEPFKSFPFHVVDEDISPEDTLQAVSFEWSGDRSVKARIRETVLTFSA